MASVTLESVSKIYRDRKRVVRAVETLDLQVADGGFVVLVGPSGCGKTTTLRMIAGLEEVTTGTIRIGDRVVNEVAPRDRDIAMVFQNYALYPHMTVFKNMAFALKIRRTPRDEIRRKVHEVATLLGIDHLLDRKPKDLSGGERQRVAVGRAIIRRPRAFLFDEPLSNLDAKLRVHMRAELKALHQKLKTTSIYVTHDQEEAMTLGDTLVIMKSGLVQQVGAPMELYNRPANRFVAGFIGTPAMNFLTGTLEGDAAGLRFVGRESNLILTLNGRYHAEATPGRSVVLGCRPEHITVTADPQDRKAAPGPPGPPPPTATENGASLPARVRVVEPLGDCLHVHLTTPGGDDLIARVPPAQPLGPDDPVTLALDRDHVHLFDDTPDGSRLT